MGNITKRHFGSLELIAILVVLFAVLGSETLLYAGTTTTTIGIGKAPIKVKDRWSGKVQTRDHNIDLEIEIFICDEQQEKVGESNHALGTVRCERHCIGCEICGGPGKNTCAKDHSKERDVVISRCTRSIADITKWLEQSILKELSKKGVTVEKGRRIYPFRPGKESLVGQVRSAIDKAEADGQKDHPDFAKRQTKKGKIKVSAKGHVGICQKGENKLSYDQTKYKVTVQVRAEVKLVKWCWVTDMSTGKRVKQFADDRECFSHKIEQRIPVGYRYEYKGHTSGWKLKNCTCCDHLTREVVSTDPTSTGLTPQPEAPPSSKPGKPGEKEPKKTHYYQGPGTGLPPSGAYGSFVISPDTTVAVRADGATASFFIDEQADKGQELEPKGDYFIGPVPRKAVVGIVTGGIVTAIVTPSDDAPTPSRGINVPDYYDGTAAEEPIEVGIPEVEQDELENYGLSAKDTTSGEVTDYGSPELYLIDNITGFGTAVYSLEGLAPGSTNLIFEDPDGNILDEKTVSIYEYALNFSPASVTRGTPVLANGYISGLKGDVPIEVTVTYDPILEVNVTSGQVRDQRPGWVCFVTTPDRLNLSPGDFSFDTSKGLGRQDVVMRIKPVE